MNTRIISILSGYNIAIYIIKRNVMTTVMIVHYTCGSRVYIGMYIHDCMSSECSDNKCFY